MIRFIRTLTVRWPLGILLAGMIVVSLGSVHAAQAGNTGNIVIPVQGMPQGGPILQAHVEVLSSPSWLIVQAQSLLGPTRIFPSEVFNFRINYVLDPNFNPLVANGDVDFVVKIDSPSIVPSFLRWHLSSTNGFDTYSGACVTSEGQSCGTSLSSDKAAPVTTVIFDGPFFRLSDNVVYLSSHTRISLTATDVAVDNAQTSGVGFTGFTLDEPVGSFSQLNSTTGSIVLIGFHQIIFASKDNAGNAEAFHSLYVLVDSTAPAAPQGLTVDGRPITSPWKNVPNFALNWTNPQESTLESGIRETFIKIDGDPEISTGPITSFVVNLGSGSAQGTVPLGIRLQDNVGNANLDNSATILLRFDNVPPASSLISPSTSSTGPIPVGFSSADSGADSVPPTGSGMDRTVLWFRRDHSGDEVFSDWVRFSTVVAGGQTPDGTGPALSSGTILFDPVAFDPATPDGAYQFYAQAFDAAGNLEPPPFPTTLPKAQTFFDRSPPVISSITVPSVSFNAARVEWSTDDETTGLVEYGTSTVFGFQRATPLGRTHSVILDCSLLSPATIFFRITATNRTDLKVVSATRSFVK